MAKSAVLARTWTRPEYERLVEEGILGEDDPVELVDGRVVVMSPERSRHVAAIDLGAEALRRVFGPGWTVRVQHPLALGTRSEPEPDLAVVRGSPLDYADAHPREAALVVEVAETSLTYDLGEKARLYAGAGVEDYWVVDLVHGRVVVHRDPGSSGYRSVVRHAPGAVLAPLEASASLEVAELLVPPRRAKGRKARR